MFRQYQMKVNKNGSNTETEINKHVTVEYRPMFFLVLTCRQTFCPMYYVVQCLLHRLYLLIHWEH
jgi:Zn-finger protein